MSDNFCCENLTSKFCFTCALTQNIREIKLIEDEWRIVITKPNIYYNTSNNNPNYNMPNLQLPV